jgi:hypothetical protein
MIGAMVSWHWFLMGAPDGVRAETTPFPTPKVNENHNENNLVSMATQATIKRGGE